MVVTTLLTFFLIFYIQEGFGIKGKAFFWIFIPATLSALAVMFISNIIVFSQRKERANFSQKEDISKDFAVFVRVIKFLFIFVAIASVFFI